jgi:hypothetical protein
LAYARLQRLPDRRGHSSGPYLLPQRSYGGMTPNTVCLNRPPTPPST